MNRIVMLLLVGSALLVGACGSSDKTENAASSAPAAAAETPTPTATSTDWPDASTEKAKSKDSGAASSSSSGDGGGSNGGGGAPKAVAIKNFAFGPAAQTVKVGQKVTWTNDDDAPHTVTGGELDSGTLAKGASFSFTPTKAGTISYICAIHPSMKGTLTVQ
jgi:plastocyanin